MIKLAILEHFHILAVFSLQNDLTPRNKKKINWEKSIFPLYSTMIMVDQELSFKNSENYFYFKGMSFDHDCPVSENW